MQTRHDSRLRLGAAADRQSPMRSRGVLLAAAVVVLSSCGPAQNTGTKAGGMGAPSVPKRNFLVHGPFSVDFSELVLAPPADGNCVAPHNMASSASSPGQTPGAAFAFTESAGLNGIDPSIAAGSLGLLVSDDHDGVAMYDKGGVLFGREPSNVSLPNNPFTLTSLFGQVMTDINKNLSFPPMSSLPPGFATPGDPNYGGVVLYHDTRIMFDSYRKRFWILAMAATKNWDASFIMTFPALKLSRRDKVALAVSKTEDPRDGFYTYWWDGTIANGSCNQLGSCGDPDFAISGEGADYPSIAIAPKYFVMTLGVNHRDPTFPTSSFLGASAWKDCNTGFVTHGQTFSNCGPFYSNLMVVDADMLVSGCSTAAGGPQSCGKGRSFGVFIDADNSVTDRTLNGDFASGLTNATSRADAYFVNNFIDHNHNAFMTVRRLVDDELVTSTYAIQPFTYGNDWNLVMSATFRSGALHLAFHNCWPDNTNCDSTSSMAIRVVGLSYTPTSGGTPGGTVIMDRNFGGNNAFDDKPSDTFRYTFPGVEVTANGDIVAVYARYGAKLEHRQQEVRFNTWIHGEPDIRPSHLLKAGEIDYATGTDTSGIAVDPTDENAVWMAHLYAAKNSLGQPCNQMAIGKVDLSTNLTITIHNVAAGTSSVVDIPACLTVAVDGTMRAYGVTSGTGPLFLAPGKHIVTEGSTHSFSPGFTSSFGGDCKADGTVEIGQYGAKTCVITNSFKSSATDTECRDNCQIARDDCMAEISQPDHPLGKDCVKAYNSCLRRCK
ncbi:MAG: hypothetical protein E6J91_26255 [Deltaproteobacteria bacterium]|nr:MAG: hypothetical protein E6J91_26255 [Deltaproteobacteria bacterium]